MYLRQLLSHRQPNPEDGRGPSPAVNASKMQQEVCDPATQWPGLGLKPLLEHWYVSWCDAHVSVQLPHKSDIACRECSQGMHTRA